MYQSAAGRPSYSTWTAQFHPDPFPASGSPEGCKSRVYVRASGPAPHSMIREPGLPVTNPSLVDGSSGKPSGWAGGPGCVVGAGVAGVSGAREGVGEGSMEGAGVGAGVRRAVVGAGEAEFVVELLPLPPQDVTTEYRRVVRRMRQTRLIALDFTTARQQAGRRTKPPQHEIWSRQQAAI